MENSTNHTTSIKVDILDHIYDKFPKVIIADSCGAAVFVIILWSVINHHILLLWLIPELIINGLGRHILTLFYFYYRKHQQIQNHTRLWHNLYIFCLFISGIFWSLGGLMYMVTPDPVYRMVIMLYMTGIIGAALPSLIPSKLSCLAFVIPVSISMFLIALSFDNLLSIALVITVLTYIVSSVNSTFSGCDAIINSFKLKYANLALANDLSSSIKLLHQTNTSLSENELALRLIQENAPIGMAIVSLSGELLQVNKAMCEITGYNKNELQGRTFQEITYPDDLDGDLALVKKLLDGTQSSYQYEKRYVQKNQMTVWVLLSVTLMRGKKGQPIYFIAQIENIDERKRDEIFQNNLKEMTHMLQICRSSTEAYTITNKFAREIFDEFSGGLAIVNSQTNNLETVYQWGESQLLKNRFVMDDCLALRSQDKFIVNDPNKDITCQHFSTKLSSGYVCIPIIIDGEIIGVMNFSTNNNKRISEYYKKNMLTFVETITISLANIRLHEIMQEQAIHDALTGLYNRYYLMNTLPRMMEETLNKNQTLCVAILDLDYFKNINDTWGHVAGDEVLKSMGEIIKENLRSNDICCRFGGEEFIVILVGISLVKAVKRLEDIRTQIENARIYFHGSPLPMLSTSIGVAEVPTHGMTTEEIISQADKALYEAKAAGRNRLMIAKSSELTTS